MLTERFHINLNLYAAYLHPQRAKAQSGACLIVEDSKEYSHE